MLFDTAQVAVAVHLAACGWETLTAAPPVCLSGPSQIPWPCTTLASSSPSWPRPALRTKEPAGRCKRGSRVQVTAARLGFGG